MIAKIKHWITCIRDYDRLAYDYSIILDHATHGRMSKICYDVQTVKAVIDDVQEEWFHTVHFEDLKEEITDFGCSEDNVKILEDYFCRRKKIKAGA